MSYWTGSAGDEIPLKAACGNWGECEQIIYYGHFTLLKTPRVLPFKRTNHRNFMKLFEDVPSKVVMTCAKWHCALFVFTPAKKKTAYAVEDPTSLYRGMFTGARGGC